MNVELDWAATVVDMRRVKHPRRECMLKDGWGCWKRSSQTQRKESQKVIKEGNSKVMLQSIKVIAAMKVKKLYSKDSRDYMEHLLVYQSNLTGIE